MSPPSGNSETYPGHDLSLSELLNATKRKLHDLVFGGRIDTSVSHAKAFQDTTEILRLAVSLGNSFAPINRIPPEVLILIPDYCDEPSTDRVLTALTHVCRRWRVTFTSRSLLWAKLDFMNVDKTRTYIQRSQSSPLEISLKSNRHESYLDDAVSLIIPHIHRLKSVTVHTIDLPEVFNQLNCPAPLLEKLEINLSLIPTPVLDNALFGGDLSFLHELRLGKAITHLPQNNLTNLRVFTLKSYLPGHEVTELLDFFESAPFLQTVELMDSIPRTSDAPPERMVSLRHLKTLTIGADAPHYTLLDHLHIPHGASLRLGFSFGGGEPPFLDYNPERSPNLGNLTHITTISLVFDSLRKYVRLSGPSGGLRLFADWDAPGTNQCTMDQRILLSLGPSILPTVQKLIISEYGHPVLGGAEKCPVFQTLSSTPNLQTLTLIDCNNLPFIVALNPEEEPFGVTPCPNLEELVLYVRSRDQFHAKSLVDMARSRASRGKRLSSVTIICLGELTPEKGVFDLKGHVGYMEYRVGDAPTWGDFFGEEDDE